MGILLCEQNFRHVWIRNKSVRAEIGQILRTHTHTTAAKLVVRIAAALCMTRFSVLRGYVFIHPLFSPFSPLETISTSLWASLHHHFPVLSIFTLVTYQFIFAHILLHGVAPSPSNPPPYYIPRYDHVHHVS